MNRIVLALGSLIFPIFFSPLIMLLDPEKTCTSSFLPKTFFLLAIFLIVYLVDLLFSSLLETRRMSKVRFFLIVSLSFRSVALFLLVFFHFSWGTNIHGVFDDYAYHLFAKGYGETIYSANAYAYFLKYLYLTFGDLSFFGRFLNIILSSLVVYPLALLGELMFKTEKNKDLVLFLYSFLPYSAFYSIFEIKDIPILFFLSLGIALSFLLEKTTRKSWLLIVFIVCCSFFLELLRQGVGFLLISGFLINVLWCEGRHKLSKPLRFLYFALFFVFLTTSIVIFLNGYLVGIHETYAKYISWINTQVTSDATRSFFIVNDFKKIWRVPFSLLAYTISPVFSNLSWKSEPFMIASGWLWKIPEQFFMITGLIGLPFLLTKLKFLNLPLIIPLIVISVWNVSNFRQGLAFTPFLLLSSLLFAQECKHKHFQKIIYYGAIFLIFLINYWAFVK